MPNRQVEQSIKLGANVNQIAKYCNQHQHENPDYDA
ncbi:plasmid mobilization relaxosome protein MobC, partial [Staphylococcus arlettae]